MRRHSLLGVSLGLAASALVASAASAASPELKYILPRGIQRGTEADLIFQGDRLVSAQEVLLYQPGISVTQIANVDAQHVRVHVKVAGDAELGEHTMRLRTASGVSDLRNFYIGPFPQVMESAPVGARKAERRGEKIPADKQPSSFESPQKIDLNTTVQGVVESEQVDYYQVQCKKGQRLTAEVEGVRLGELFDPYVAIVNDKQFEVAACDDTALTRQDPIASCIIPADGAYVVEVRESAYGGSETSYYRLHVGTFPRPMGVYPAGGPPNEEMTVHFLADVLGPIEYRFKVPPLPHPDGGEIGLFAQQDGLSAPSPNWFRVSPLPNVLAARPNQRFEEATPANRELPLAFNGIIEKPGDVDFFKFKAHKDTALDIRVYARKLRSPLDSVITLYNDKGGAINSNDDSGGPDSYLRFNVPADGEYGLSIQDQLHRGGPDYVYRIEITKVEPTVSVTIPNATNLQASQDRQAIAVPRGNFFGTLMRVKRENFGGPIALSAPDLPAGVTMHCEGYIPGQDLVPVVFEAADSAAVAGKLCDLTCKSTDPKENVEGRFEQIVELVNYQNNGGLFNTRAEKLAVAVTDPAPFKIHIVEPKVPLPQSGEMSLKIVAERKAGFTQPINLKMLWDAPGVSAGNVTIPGDKSEFDMALSASPNATPHKWQIAVLGQADVSGPLWVSTPLAPLEVSPTFMTVKIGRSAVEQGQSVSVPLTIESGEPFEGKAKLQLLGLPAGITAPDIEVGPGDKQASFALSTTKEAPKGTHTSLMCRVTILKNGQPIVENLGQGGVLRVDAPTPPKAGAKAPEPAKAQPAGQPPKSMSRLEKLRQDQQSQK